MNSNSKLESALQQLRQAEQKVVFVREAILSLQQPTLAHLKVLRDYQMDAYSEHLEAIMRFPEDAVDEQEEESDSFEELFHEVSRVMAKKHSAARRSSAPPSSAADQLAAETWLKQQIKAWESLKVDVPEQPDEDPKNEILELQGVSVAETPSEFGADSSRTRSSNQPTLNDSQQPEEPVDNPSADATSDLSDVANRGPQPQHNKREDSVDQPASIRGPNDVAARVSRDQLLPATNPCLGHTEGGSKVKPGPDPARISGINNQPRRSRVHPDSDHSTKVIEEHDPLLPSIVKAPDKRGHPYLGRFHPEYGPSLKTDPTGKSDHSVQPHERRWHPTVPPDKAEASEANENQLPGKIEDVESPQPGGGCSVPPKRKPHLRTRRRTPMCAPLDLTVSLDRCDAATVNKRHPKTARATRA